MKKLLLHVCCAPCTSGVYPYFARNYQVSGFFYNPNIHPYQEFNKRLTCLKDYADKEDLPMIYDENYQLEKFLRAVVFRENERCLICYRLRLEKTAQTAVKEGFPMFSTTLLISPYQKLEHLRQVGEQLAAEYKVEFYFEDLTRFFKFSVQRSRELGLYRQPYCGCVYSERDRYKPKQA